MKKIKIASDREKRKPRLTIPRQCMICKLFFIDTTYNHNKKFCSISCRNKSHREYVKQALKDWRNKNYEKFKAQWTRSNNKNKERHKLRRKRLVEELGGKCVICGFDKNLHLHHKIPLSEGGTNKPENLVPLCPNHHVAIHRSDIKLIVGEVLEGKKE